MADNEETPVDLEENSGQVVADSEPKEEAAQEKFRAGEWNGLPNYKCPYCEFYTLDGELSIVDHAQKQHPREEI